MSRVGTRIITIPEGVSVTNDFDNQWTVKGPKGSLTKKFDSVLKILVNDSKIKIERPNDLRKSKMIHGTTNSLLQGMIIGVTEGYEKTLLIKGVGYNVKHQADTLIFSLGKSHKDEMKIPSHLKAEVISNTEFKISGIDKQQVGEFAMVCKKLRKPEPYGGKGIMYKGEYIRRKAGKVAK